MMKKMTHALALALALMLTLAACSSGTESGSTTAPHTIAAAVGTTGAPALNESASTVPATASDGFPQGSEQYLDIRENDFRSTDGDSMLTFSLKVDTAAYTNVARYIRGGQLPPADAVRTEELINYFAYDGDMVYTEGHPFAVYTEIAPSPFDTEKSVAFIRVKTREIDKSDLPPSSLIFLIDTSGSMNSHDKLPLLQEAFRLLVDTLNDDDQVGIVTYAGSAGVALRPTADRQAILDAIDSLSSGGSTAGAQGIQTAYQLAEEFYLEGGNNRIILATDGDFNVGVSSTAGLSQLVREKRDSGIYLSILGFGTGNLRDDIMETLSKDGSGNYAYIDSTDTARKVLVDELGANLYTVADDVKAQIEFNPQNVKSYRLIGYENRQLDNRDFADDAKDAGEVGAGSDVILLFEFEPQEDAVAASGLKYSGESGGLTQPKDSSGPYADELFEVRIRYKEPGERESKLLVSPVTFGSYQSAGSTDFRFACAVAALGDLLRGSRYAGDITADDVLALAKESMGRDSAGYRLDFVLLLGEYRALIR